MPGAEGRGRIRTGSHVSSAIFMNSAEVGLFSASVNSISVLTAVPSNPIAARVTLSFLPEILVEDIVEIKLLQKTMSWDDL